MKSEDMKDENRFDGRALNNGTRPNWEPSRQVDCWNDDGHRRSK